MILPWMPALLFSLQEVCLIYEIEHLFHTIAPFRNYAATGLICKHLSGMSTAFEIGLRVYTCSSLPGALWDWAITLA